MQFEYISVKEVIANVIRFTRVQDNSYIFAMQDWIPQGMEILRTKHTLANKWQDLNISFHKGDIPYGCRTIKGVEVGGHKLRRGNSVRTLGIPGDDHHHHHSPLGTTNGFEYVPQFYDTPPKDNPQEDSVVFTQDIVSLSFFDCEHLPWLEHHWYDVEPGYILCSIENVRMRVHYRAIPLDEAGFPLIPDNGDYKMALYYFCRAMMIGAGFEDKVFTFDKLMDETSDGRGGKKGYFWQSAARAMGQIRYPSVDQMEFKVNEHVRLVKDENYFHNWYSSSEKERKYGYDEYLYNLSPGGPARTYLTSPGNHSQG